jgi:hypothetical protein
VIPPDPLSGGDPIVLVESAVTTLASDPEDTAADDLTTLEGGVYAAGFGFAI